MSSDDPLDGYPVWMTAAQVSEYTNVTEQTLAQWRVAGRGPRWVKLTEGRNGPVRYSREDLRGYLADRLTPATPHTAQEPAHNEPVTA